MGVTNGVISTQGAISISDVRSAIGDASYDLGTLCKSSKVQRWSRYKPLRKAGLNLTSTDWYKGDYYVEAISNFNGIAYSAYWLHTYSLKILAFSYLDDMIKHLVLSIESPYLNKYNCSGNEDDYETNLESFWQNNYSYERPIGGVSSPYRIGDFKGYSHNARCGFYTDFMDDPYYINEDTVSGLQKLNAQNDLEMSIKTTISVSGSAREIGLYDLFHRFSSTVKLVAIPIWKPSAQGLTYWAARTSNPESNSVVIDSTANWCDLSVLMDYTGTPGFPVTEGNEKIVGLINCVKLEGVSLGSGVTAPLYIPITQSGSAYDLENTISSVGKRYSVKFFNMTTEPLGNMSALAICTYPQGVSTGWINIQSFIGSEQTVTGGNLTIKLQAPKPKTAYQVTKANFKFEFAYEVIACPADTTREDEKGTLCIDSSNAEASALIHVRKLNSASAAPSNTADFTSETVTVSTDNDHTYLEVGLSRMLTVISGQPNLAECSVKITHMVMWHGNTLVSKTWFPMMSESLTMIMP